MLLLTASRFVPVFILDLADSEPSLRKLVDSFRARRPSLASLEAVSLADSQVVADLASKIPTGPPLKKDYIVIYGSEAPVDCSLKPGQPSLLHILLLAALDQDNLRETIGRELLHLLTPLPEDSSSENLSQSPPTDLPQPLERAEGLVPALEAKSTAQTDSLNNVASAVSSGMSAVSVVSTSVQQTVAPAGYRLVTFDELEKVSRGSPLSLATRRLTCSFCASPGLCVCRRVRRPRRRARRLPPLPNLQARQATLARQGPVSSAHAAAYTSTSRFDRA